MKVTKAMREFIEDSIYTKAKQSQRMAELKRKADETEESFIKDVERLENECQVFVKELVDKYKLETKPTPKAHFSCCHVFNLPDVIAYRKAQEELNKQVRKTILDIIVSMELGGTKAELMAKLDAIQF